MTVLDLVKRAVGGSQREQEAGKPEPVTVVNVGVKLPGMRGYQRPVLESPARFKLLMCGRRWGKTKVGVTAACAGHGPAAESGTGSGMGPARMWHGALFGGRIGWVVPSEDHPSAAEVWSDLKKALGGVRRAREEAPWLLGAPGSGLVHAEISEAKRLIELPGGGSVRVWSGFDPDTLRGPYFDGVVVDECSLQDDGVWAAVRPTLSDYGGWALLMGTVPADAQTHWFVGAHRRAESEEWRELGWETWRRPSWENPQLTEADLREAKATLGARTFAREYGAELLSAEGGIWKEEWFRFYDPDELPAEDALMRVELYLDAAWTTGVGNCASSCQAWGRTETGYYLLGELHGKWEAPELRRRVAAFRSEWATRFPEKTVALVVEEAGGGAVVAQELRDAYDFPVIDYEVKGNSKVARAELVTSLAEGGKVFVPDPSAADWVREWLAEVSGFPQLKEKDRADALAMALQRLREVRRPEDEFPFAMLVPEREWYERERFLPGIVRW